MGRGDGCCGRRNYDIPKRDAIEQVLTQSRSLTTVSFVYAP